MTLGDVSVVGDVVHYVDFVFTGAGIDVAVRALDTRGEPVAFSVPVPVSGGSAFSMAVDERGTVYASTGDTGYEISAAGEATTWREGTTHAAIVDVSSEGELLSRSADSADEVDFVIAGGSSEARKILKDGSENCSSSLRVGDTVLPFLCRAAAAAWIAADSFIVSMGSEGGAILARVDKPASS